LQFNVKEAKFLVEKLCKLLLLKSVADKRTAYLHGELTLSDLVDWAENIMMESDFEENHFEVLRKIVEVV